MTKKLNNEIMQNEEIIWINKESTSKLFKYMEQFISLKLVLYLIILLLTVYIFKVTNRAPRCTSKLVNIIYVIKIYK